MSPGARGIPATDPGAVRVTLVQGSPESDLPPLVVAPGKAVRVDGVLVSSVLVDGDAVNARLHRRDAVHGQLVEASDHGSTTTSLVMVPPASSVGGTVRREVIVDGWRVVVDVESEQHASLRERARRGRSESIRGGRTELRAVIPGRIVSVSVAPGDTVILGQPVLVVEAMKMQNEIRAPRDGVVASVETGSGRTIEVGDLLLVLE
jgi:biotin carboxyl carrier protein